MIFTRDLALLLKSGARIDTALDLLASEIDIGRLRPIVRKIGASILGGESFTDALAHHEVFFLTCTSRWCGSVRRRNA